MKSLFFSAVSVASVVIGVAGVVTFFLGLKRLLTALRSTKWPRVKGTVLSATLETHAEPPTSDDEAGPPMPTYGAALRYRYEVDGKTFEGTRIGVDEIETSDAKRAEALLNQYPASSSVDVFYEPTDPAQSVLKPGISGASAVFPAIGVALMVLGMSIFAVVWKVSGH